MPSTEGRRLHDPSEGSQPGDYWYWEGGHRWMAKTPNGHVGDLSQHAVTEHEDGTITVSPSILVTDGEHPWHGYLERGVWREV